MFKKTVKCENFNGEVIEEDLYFNLTKAEVLKMELETPGGYAAKLKEMYLKKDIPLIMKYMNEIILDAYGVKSPDGRKFMKSPEIRADFEATNAYSEFLVELLTDADKATAFINAIFPVEANAEAIEEAKKELNM